MLLHLQTDDIGALILDCGEFRVVASVNFRPLIGRYYYSPCDEVREDTN